MPEQCARLIDELIELRKARGWTQQDLAKACGLCRIAERTQIQVPGLNGRVEEPVKSQKTT